MILRAARITSFYRIRFDAEAFWLWIILTAALLTLKLFVVTNLKWWVVPIPLALMLVLWFIGFMILKNARITG